MFIAQGTRDSIDVTGYTGESGAGVATVRAEWLEVDGRDPQFKFSVLGTPGDVRQVDPKELLVAAVDQYLDQRIEFTRNGVQTAMPVSGITAGVDRLIALALMHFQIPVIALSEATRRQLLRVCSIDWSQASFGVDGGDDQEKYMAIFYYLRAQRNELERNLRSDLSPLTGVQLRINEPVGAKAPPKPLQVPTVCTTVFDDQNYLCALDLRMDSTMAAADVQLTDDVLSDIAVQAGKMKASAPQPRLGKRDRWLKAELDAINQRLDHIDQRRELWALRDRMDSLEGRIDELGRRVDLLGSEAGAVDRSENPVAGLSALTGKNLSIQFALGSAALGSTQKQLLDEVVRAMTMEPSGRLLLTGHADRIGDPALNMALSEQRAKAVRSFLLARGVSGERVLLNYSGSRYSTGASAAERRVSLDWIR
ncbi:MAG: OmpA family protein [Flavobacteriales bacterium]|nr:OmpA family protein [Flavobacteriales bacterium]